MKFIKFEATVRKTLFDLCQSFDPLTLAQIVEVAGGAAYLYWPDKVMANAAQLQQALVGHYPKAKIAVSYKTNYSSLLIKSALSAGALHEVVSAEELSYARSLGADDKEIIVNGPGKSQQYLKQILSSDVTMLIDSINELKAVQELMQLSPPRSARLGIRVNPQLSFYEGRSRFGIDLENEAERDAVKSAVADGLDISGIHMHLTADRSATSYLERLTYLADRWDALDIGPLKFINCGGGFASAIPEEIAEKLPYKINTLQEYGDLIGAWLAERFGEDGPEFLCEPGTGLFADTGVFITPVLDTKSIEGSSIAIIDGTIFTINPLRSTVQPAVHKVASQHKAASVREPVKIYGNSCMEIDVVMDEFLEPLAKGDLLIFAQKGAYASCMAPAFIQGVPAIVAIDEAGDFTVQRPRTGANILEILN